MDSIAGARWDVYLIDVRGYGRSTPAPELAQEGAGQGAIVSTETKVHDVGSVVNFILKRRGARKVNLLGWSWGTIVTASYAAAHGDRANSLVLHALGAWGHASSMPAAWRANNSQKWLRGRLRLREKRG
jgi:pimeloyl-ACP methyl ester carboxylesterase